MINVVCAVIIFEGKVLVTQRRWDKSNPNKWEFPGGKVEQYETNEESLIREIKEELNITIQPIYKMDSVIYHYQDVSVNLFPYIAEKMDGEIKLKDHQQHKYYSLDELKDLDWIDADVGIVKQLYKIRNNFGL